MKICNTCNVEKNDFDYRLGHARCRDCTNSARRAEYHSDPSVQEANRQRTAQYREDNREKLRESWAKWYAKNKPARSEYNKEYQKRPEVRPVIAERARTRHLRDAHVSARRLIQARVANGKMPRAVDCFCMDCGDRAAEYDHYLGYTGKAREAVQPVCKPCHQARTNTREKVD